MKMYVVYVDDDGSVGMTGINKDIENEIPEDTTDVDVTWWILPTDIGIIGVIDTLLEAGAYKNRLTKKIICAVKKILSWVL